MNAGWPLFGYDAKLLSIPAETLPDPDGYFDAVISANALDHLDDFDSRVRNAARPQTPR